MTDTSVELCGLKLDNPVVPASGTFGYGNEFREFYDINILGSFSFKGTTREARFGNPTPRIAECGAGMINAVGLQNPGIDAVIREELPRLKTFFRKPVIANISGFSVEEYAYCCERIDRQEQVGLIEVNVSCPNVRHGGMSFGTSPECAAEVTRAVKAVTTKPVFIKLSPNVTDIVAIARACEEAGADGICLINTLLGMRIDIARRRPGILFGIGLIGTFLTRFFIEYIKTEQEPFEVGWALDMGQWLSIPFILLGIYMIWRGATRPGTVPAPVPKAPAATPKKKKK
mgnify:CR=1 FL=1